VPSIIGIKDCCGAHGSFRFPTSRWLNEAADAKTKIVYISFMFLIPGTSKKGVYHEKVRSKSIYQTPRTPPGTAHASGQKWKTHLYLSIYCFIYDISLDLTSIIVPDTGKCKKQYFTI
jgi:hypothetical protein